MGIGSHTFLQSENRLMREKRIWEGYGESTAMNSGITATENRRPSLRGELRLKGAMNRSNPLPEALMVDYRCPSLRRYGLLRHAPPLSLRCPTRNDDYKSSCQFNHIFYHVYSPIRHINMRFSKTNFNFES